jgi:hypothetical protein
VVLALLSVKRGGEGLGVGSVSGVVQLLPMGVVACPLLLVAGEEQGPTARRSLRRASNLSRSAASCSSRSARARSAVSSARRARREVASSAAAAAQTWRWRSASI